MKKEKERKRKKRERWLRAKMIKSFSLRYHGNLQEKEAIASRVLKENLFSGIEIAYPYDTDTTNPTWYEDVVSRLVSEHSPVVTCHIPYYLSYDLNSIAHYRNLYGLAKDAIEFGAKFGARKFTIHPISQIAAIPIRERYSSYIADTIRKAKKSAKDATILYLREVVKNLPTGGVLAIENLVNSIQYGADICDLTDLLSELSDSRFAITLDLGHLRVANIDVVDAFRELRNSIVNVHVHSNDGLYDQHKLPSECLIDTSTDLSHLLKNGYNSTVVVESFWKTYEQVVETSEWLDKAQTQI